jgi:hypothetical protein
MPSIHKQELESRRSFCNTCPLNNGKLCLGNNKELKHNLLVGFCSKDLWIKNFKPKPYINPNKKQVIRKKKKPPKIKKQILSFANSMKEWASDRFKVVSNREHKRRLAICLACPSLDPDGWGGSGRCLECGCSVKAKTKIRSQKCPIGKW